MPTPLYYAQSLHPQAAPVGLAAIPMGGSKPVYLFSRLSGQSWIPLGGPWTAHNACIAIKWMKAHYDPYTTIYVFRWGNDFNYEMTLSLGHLPGSLPDVNLSNLNAC